MVAWLFLSSAKYRRLEEVNIPDFIVSREHF
jgi:hypothetical protein